MAQVRAEGDPKLQAPKVSRLVPTKNNVFETVQLDALRADEELFGVCYVYRAYFRCTHKYDQLCTAQRQVQRCDDDPASYRVTYIGEHTCRDPATAPIIAAHVIHQVAAGDNDDGCGGLQAGSRLISFVAAPAAPVDAAVAPTTSTITTVTAPGPLLQPLKVEGGVGSSDQEEVLSSLTPGSSAARGGGGGGGVAGPFGPDQGDVTSSLHWSYDAVAGMEFFKNDEVVFDLDDIMGLSF